MNREFQAVYRLAGGDELKTINLIALRAEQVRENLSAPGIEVIAITEVRPIVDWDKPVWDRDEFAAALGMTPDGFSHKKGDGKIPWSDTYRGVPRRVALKCIEDTLNAAGKIIVKELEAA